MVDRYSSFIHLAANEQVGIDYRIRVVVIRSPDLYRP